MNNIPVIITKTMRVAKIPGSVIIAAVVLLISPADDVVELVPEDEEVGKEEPEVSLVGVGGQAIVIGFMRDISLTHCVPAILLYLDPAE